MDPLIADLNELDDLEELHSKDVTIHEDIPGKKTTEYHELLNKFERGDEPAYELILEWLSECEREILSLHSFICRNYWTRFSELESIVTHPMDYARVVKRIGKEEDMTSIDFKDLVPTSIALVLSMVAAVTNGKPGVRDDTLMACERLLELDNVKAQVLNLVEKEMNQIAPNLTAIIGSRLAAELMAAAGGLHVLANMPACNVQVLGAKREHLAGFSTVPHVGLIFYTEVIQRCPASIRLRACRLVSGKATLAARVDANQEDNTGLTGGSLKEEIEKKIKKWQEAPPVSQPKSLRVPDCGSNQKNRRGGRRARKMKERYGLTDMRRLVNRLKFGVPEQSSLRDGYGDGYGMLGQSGCGKLRLKVKKTKLI